MNHKKLIAAGLVLLGLALSAVVGFSAYEDINAQPPAAAADGR